MASSQISLEILDVPGPIRSKIKDLSESIKFTKRSRKGACGWLFFGQNIIHKQKVAIKFYDWGGDHRYHAEPKHLAAIDSANVVKILDAAFVDTDYAFFITPYFEKGDLDEEICSGIRGNLRAVSVVRDILSGLSHLHSQNLVHRDLKAQNILITDNDTAVIGDFGSVKRIPVGATTVPGSGHSLIYTPPESILSGIYGFSGDIYQVGLVLFQMLGGHFPYEEYAWLNSRELKNYRTINDDIDRQLFAKDCIYRKIRAGRVVQINSLPPWVCDPLKRIISRACNVAPSKRYTSCSEFLSQLNSIRSQVHDWCIEDGVPVRKGNTRYRICFNEKTGQHFVQKGKTAGWRTDNSFGVGALHDLVLEIEGKA